MTDFHKLRAIADRLDFAKDETIHKDIQKLSKVEVVELTYLLQKEYGKDSFDVKYAVVSALECKIN